MNVHRAWPAIALGTLALTTLAACTSSSGTGSGTATTPGSSGPAGGSSSAPAPAAAITITPGADAARFDPAAPVRVQVAHGTLTSVVMRNPFGKKVTGTMTGDAWHTTEALGYGRKYTIRATAKNADGRQAASRASFTTINPSRTVGVSMDRMGDYAMTDGATYGVAIVPVVHFDNAPADRKAAVRALSVTTSRKIDGAWAWTSPNDVAYRPRNYWPAHTRVTVHAHVYGVDVGDGVYGASDESVHFTVGRKQTTVADDNAPHGVDKVRVRNAQGTLLRVMNTSMGQHSGEEVNGSWINFYTLNGTYTVLEHDNPAIMDSQSYGLPASDPHGYGKLSVPYSSKISTDGIYLHEYNSTIYDQDNGIDVSEGCLNLRTADAAWFYNHSLIGDPVVVHGAKGAPEIAVDEGGDWSVPWSKWTRSDFDWN